MSAQLSLLDAPTASLDGLKPQCRKAIRLMIDNGGLTRLEAMHAGIGNLPARILEIRAEFGDDAVETMNVPHTGSPYARYVWRGPDLS